MPLIPVKSFDENARGTLDGNTSEAFQFGAFGNFLVDSTTSTEELASGSGSFLGPGDAILEHVQSIGIIGDDGPIINKLYLGKYLTIRENNYNMAQGGSTTTIVLPSVYSSDNRAYLNRPIWKADTFIYIKDGTNQGEIRKVSSYNGTTKTVTVASAFPFPIDVTSEFEIIDGLDVLSRYNLSTTKRLTIGTYISMQRSPFLIVGIKIPDGVTGVAEIHFARARANT